jgi:hypothetical protein
VTLESCRVAHPTAARNSSRARSFVDHDPVAQPALEDALDARQVTMDAMRQRRALEESKDQLRGESLIRRSLL